MQTNISYKAFTMEYGTFIGIAWSLCFLSYTYGVINNNSMLLMLCLLLLCVGGIMPFLLALRLAMKVPAKNRMSFFQGLGFSFTMFMWACLFDGIIVYSYFEFFDNGAFIDALVTILSDKQLAQTYTQIGMGESYKQILSMMNEIAQTSSFDKALALFNNNFLLSLLLSIPVALVAKTKIEIVRK